MCVEGSYIIIEKQLKKTFVIQSTNQVFKQVIVNKLIS